MKTPITEVERREIEQKIQGAVGDTIFDTPWPEFFLAIGMSSKEYAEAVAALAEEQNGRICTHLVIHEGKNSPWRDVVVTSNTKHGQHVLFRFRLN